MPTPVSVARQCLTEEAARVLDDAVSVARRRSHAQTTSLHTISALLSMPSSALRDACARTRSSAFSSRLQFRALELCVGVSLDRVPSTKGLDDDPPISNSLMAAIKRSQANQRRHPDNFHLQQIHFNQQTSSVLKVEVKHFVLSILDDPTVSRVFGEAGFRSCDIKLAILHPPLSPTSATFSRSRCPPIFLCNLTDPDAGRPGFGFPFGDCEDGDENCRRIGEVLVRKDGKSGKNPFLIGAFAGEALRKFTECVNGDKGGVLPSELRGLSLICIEREVSELVREGDGDKEKMSLKFGELGHKLELCPGPGIVVSLGDLKLLVGDNVCTDSVSYFVSKSTELLDSFSEKLWIIGAAASYDVYMKFLGLFPNVGKDWDLHILPITSSKSPKDIFGSKSSLMGSFVPFGGFFSTPSDSKNPLTTITQPVTRCHLCTAKYEQEAAVVMKTGSVLSVADQYSENLPPWLQMAELEMSKGMDAAKTVDDRIALNAKIFGLQKKWNDICQRLHGQPFSKVEVSQAMSRIPIVEGSQHILHRKESSSNSSSRDSSLNESHRANPSLGSYMDLQKRSPSKHIMPVPVTSRVDSSFQSNTMEDLSKRQEKEKESPWINPHLPPSLSLPTDHTSSSSVTSVTTDLGLGTLYAAGNQEISTPRLHNHEEHLPHYKGFKSEHGSARESTSRQVAQSFSYSGLPPGGQFDSRDYKSMRGIMAEKVRWQDEAISTIVEAVSRCKAGYGRNCGSSARRDIWLAFLGPDKVGKKKIAALLAEVMFGSLQNFVTVDFSSHDGVGLSNSIFQCQELNDYDVKFRGKTVVDYIAMELRKRSHSLLFIENVDKADFLAQTSLSQAIKTGKFPYSGGEISVSNVIFVTTSIITSCNKKLQLDKSNSKFSEETILGAKCWQMKIEIEQAAAVSAGRSNERNERVSGKLTCTTLAVNKRKLEGSSTSTEQETNLDTNKRSQKTMRTHLDLNLPVEETDENINYGDYSESDSISEDSEAWLEEFFDLADGKVEFKPFDFDALAGKIMEEITSQTDELLGPDIVLEVGEEALVHIIAASWLSEKKRGMEDWVESVLSRGLEEAKLKCQPNVKYIMKLISCEGIVAEEQPPGIHLPARIHL